MGRLSRFNVNEEFLKPYVGEHPNAYCTRLFMPVSWRDYSGSTVFQPGIGYAVDKALMFEQSNRDRSRDISGIVCLRGTGAFLATIERDLAADELATLAVKSETTFGHNDLVDRLVTHALAKISEQRHEIDISEASLLALAPTLFNR